MRRDEGLAVLQAGETVIPKGQSAIGGNFVFNIRATDPRAAAEEFRQVLEEQFLKGRLGVS